MQAGISKFGVIHIDSSFEPSRFRGQYEPAPPAMQAADDGYITLIRLPVKAIQVINITSND